MKTKNFLTDVICDHCRGPIKLIGGYGKFRKYKGHVWRHNALEVERGFIKTRFYGWIDCANNCQPNKLPVRVELTECEFMVLLATVEEPGKITDQRN